MEKEREKLMLEYLKEYDSMLDICKFATGWILGSAAAGEEEYVKLMNLWSKCIDTQKEEK